MRNCTHDRKVCGETSPAGREGLPGVGDALAVESQREGPRGKNEAAEAMNSKGGVAGSRAEWS